MGGKHQRGVRDLWVRAGLGRRGSGRDSGEGKKVEAEAEVEKSPVLPHPSRVARRSALR